MEALSNRISFSSIDDVEERFQDKQLLGKGSFAEVFKAKDKTNGRQVALKQIFVRQLQANQACNEAQRLSKVQNDHIIRYYQTLYDESESNVVVVMELCGGSLRQQMASKTYSDQQLISFVTQMVSAFLEINRHGLMHLDLKPQNILISKSNSKIYKICDFGCTQLAFHSKVSYESTQFGTFNYLAPQNYLFDKFKTKPGHTKTSSDAWSLGLILYQMIFRRLPLPLNKNMLIDRKSMQLYCNNDLKIDYSGSKAGQYILGILKGLLKSNPQQRLTWQEIRNNLMHSMLAQQCHFLNTKSVYFMHMKLLKIFISMVWSVRKNTQFNPNRFWKKDPNNFSKLCSCLLHLCYIYSNKFMKVFGFKLKDCLQSKWLNDLDFMNKHIQIQQSNICKQQNQDLTTQNSIQQYQSELRQTAAKIRQQFKRINRYAQQLWDSMMDLQTFLIEIGKRGKDSYFAIGNQKYFSQSMKRLQIHS